MKSYIKFINEGKYTSKNLSTRFWTDFQLDDGVRKKLVTIAKDFYNGLDVDLEIKKILLTGSLANFNYTDHSDLDIHIIVDFREYDEDEEIFKEMIQTKTFVWNLKHDINIRGADVELYVQGINEEHQSTGLFSLSGNKWIKKPEYTDPDVDEDDVRDKYNKWVSDINKLNEGISKNLSDEEYKEYFNKTDKMKKKLKKFRRKGLNDGEGEFSVENIIFKKLRNNGYIKTLYDISDKYYDRIFSQ